MDDCMVVGFVIVIFDSLSLARSSATTNQLPTAARSTGSNDDFGRKVKRDDIGKDSSLYEGGYIYFLILTRILFLGFFVDEVFSLKIDPLLINII